MEIKVNLPEQCRINQPVTMSISGIPKKFDDAVVFVTSSSFEIKDKRWQPASWTPVKFEIIPREPGMQIIEVELFHGTARVAYAVVEAEIK